MVYYIVVEYNIENEETNILYIGSIKEIKKFLNEYYNSVFSILIHTIYVIRINQQNFEYIHDPSILTKYESQDPKDNIISYPITLLFVLEKINDNMEHVPVKIKCLQIKDNSDKELKLHTETEQIKKKKNSIFKEAGENFNRLLNIIYNFDKNKKKNAMKNLYISVFNSNNKITYLKYYEDRKTIIVVNKIKWA